MLPSTEVKTRLPLQIGIQSLFSLALACGTFVPGLLLFLLTAFILFVKGAFLILALLVSQGWIIGLTIVGVEIWLLVMGVRHMRFALRTRPADVWIDDDGLRVDGGRMHGTTVRWADCRGVREEADSEEVDISKPTNLVVDTKLKGQKHVVVAQALDETELASLRALRETIEAKLAPATKVAPVETTNPDMLRCPACSAPCAPRDADETTCAFCSASVPVPTPLRERLRAMTDVVASSKIARTLLPKLLDQPGARMTSVLMVAIGIPIALAWLLAVVFAVFLWRDDGFRTANFGALSVAAVVIVVGSYYLLRFWLVNRMALGVVTLQYGAFAPANDGAPWRCRSCDGPLTTTGESLVVRCVWCESDNVLGVDTRPQAAGARREWRTLEAAFERRAADRKKYGRNLAIAVALLPVAVWLFVRGTQPLDTDARLAVACAHGDGQACLDRGKLLLGYHDRQLAAYETGCERGVEDACIEYAKSEWYASDLTRSTALLRASCNRKQLESCMKLGELVQKRFAKDWETPEALYKQACDGGYEPACTPYAVALLARHADREARGVLERSCAAKEPTACGQLGMIVDDAARKIPLLTSACPASPVACNALAEAYWTGHGVAVDHARAAELFKTACDVPIATACTRYGEYAEEVKPKAYDVIVTWYNAGCVNGDPQGCLHRGMTESRQTRGQWKAFKTYDDTCRKHRVGEACTRAARMRRDGVSGVRVDVYEAQDLFTIGCDENDAASCNGLAQLAHNAADYKTAHPLFAKACELGELNACNWLAFETDKGQGVAPDAAAARTIYERTCAVKPETSETQFACGKLK